MAYRAAAAERTEPMRRWWHSAAALLAGVSLTGSADATSITSYGSIVLNTIGTDSTAAADGSASGGIPVPARSSSATDAPAPPGTGGTNTDTSTSTATEAATNSPAPESGTNSGTPSPVAPEDAVPATPGSDPAAGPDTSFPPVIDPREDEEPVFTMTPDPVVDVPSLPVDEMATTSSPSGVGGSGPVAETPEPASIALLGTAGVAAWLASRRRLRPFVEPE